MKHRLRRWFYRFHRDNLKMVNEANECQLNDKAKQIISHSSHGPFI